MNKFFCGCDVGSTYTKCVILDDSGEIISNSTIRSRVDPELSSRQAIDDAITKSNGRLSDPKDLSYIVGTGYGRNKVVFANKNISEISCHAMGVHVADPSIRTIIDLGGQDLKGISITPEGTVNDYSMNDKCAAGTGRFFENMARAFEVSLEDFVDLSLTANSIIPISSQCSVFAESEVITLMAEKKPKEDIAAGIQKSVAKRCVSLLRKVGVEEGLTMSGGCAKNTGLKKALEKLLRTEIITLNIDPQLMGALGAAEFARKHGLAV